MPLSSVSTPAALIDASKMQLNIDRMQAAMRTLNVQLRPHVKTAKCVAVAQRQVQAGATGITVSTLKEAKQFFNAGFNNILYAVSIAPQKLAQAAQLLRQGCRLVIVTDSLAGAQAITQFAKAQQIVFEVWIEIDTDNHRSGVKPNSNDLIPIGQCLQQGGAILGGVLTHAGSSYELNTPEALIAMAEQERSLCVLAANRLRAAGLPCPNISVGSTPTALSATQLDGVTEVRAGVYVFFDLVMSNVGVCNTSDIALSVLTSVIGHQAEKGWVIIDAGWMAMSRDRGTEKQTTDYGYGQVCDVEGRVLTGFQLTGANQEHGIVSQIGQPDGNIVKRFPIGTLLRILPNHACATAAQFPTYAVLENDGSVNNWDRFYGW
jgi:D-serine deaminase-like pyridoxal phosphate-dependent protein